MKSGYVDMENFRIMDMSCDVFLTFFDTGTTAVIWHEDQLLIFFHRQVIKLRKLQDRLFPLGTGAGDQQTNQKNQKYG